MTIYLGDQPLAGLLKPLAYRNIGEIVSSTLPLTDAGLHLLDGSVLSGGGIEHDFVDYIANLYNENPTASYFVTEANWQTAVTNYGVCGKFVYDSVNNTVRLPKITGILEGTTDLTALGDLVEAGLPNIRASITNPSTNPYSDVFDLPLSSLSGAFSGTSRSLFMSINGEQSGLFIDSLNFNASQYNPIYKDNFNKVQPQTIKALYYIVIATTTKTEIEIDIDRIATDLYGKADVDGSNMNPSVKNFDGRWTYANALLTQATAAGSYTIDLSPYLPNDGYSYEVILRQLAQGHSGAPISFFNSAYISECYGVWSTSEDSHYDTINIILAIDPNKQFVMKISQADFIRNEVRLSGYRRIGTNQ